MQSLWLMNNTLHTSAANTPSENNIEVKFCVKGGTYPIPGCEVFINMAGMKPANYIPIYKMTTGANRPQLPFNHWKLTLKMSLARAKMIRLYHRRWLSPPSCKQCIDITPATDLNGWRYAKTNIQPCANFSVASLGEQLTVRLLLQTNLGSQ